MQISSLLANTYTLCFPTFDKLEGSAQQQNGQWQASNDMLREMPDVYVSHQKGKRGNRVLSQGF